MSTHPIGSGSPMQPPEWQQSSHVYSRSQVTAAVRAALIALVLLAGLVVMILL